MDGCRSAVFVMAVLVPLFMACTSSGRNTATQQEKGPASLKLTSSAFRANGALPRRSTCDGAGVSPPLSWSGLPKGTRSLALIVDDPDAPDPRAPKRVWVHWVLYDIPPTAAGLAEHVASASLPSGTREGLNDLHRTGFGPACPPTGRHRYFFKLYALDEVLPDLKRPTKAQLLAAMDGHVLAKTALMGTYQRGK